MTCIGNALLYPSRPWTELPLVILDTETTGLDPATDRIVEIAAVLLRPDGTHSSLSSLLNPGMRIPAEASAIHGIHDANVVDAPRFQDVWPGIRPLLDGAIVCAYNAPFDREFIRAEAVRSLPEPRDIPRTMRGPWLDPLVWVRELDRYVKGAGRHKLAATCERWLVQMGPAHQAASDAEAAGRLMLAMARKLADTHFGGACPTPGALLDLQGQLAADQEERFRAFQRANPLPAKTEAA
jgi:DNA polymerase-3 subunit epsilon